MRKKDPAREKIILALDLADHQEAKRHIDALASLCSMFKVGLQLFLAGGWEIIDYIRQKDCRVMLDLKFHDIPATVQHATEQVCRHEIDLMTVHAESAEAAMAAAAVRPSLKILAVTLLTSVATEDASQITLQRGEKALSHHCHGLVASAQEAGMLRKHFGKNFLLATPGIRFEETADDQRRTASVEEALRAGADYLVIGRPVIQSKDPVGTLQKIKEMAARTSSSTQSE